MDDELATPPGEVDEPPAEVALPLHVTADLHAPGTLLGLYWMLFGVGAVLGGLTIGALRQLPLWPVTVAIVVCWGLTLLPFGIGRYYIGDTKTGVWQTIATVLTCGLAHIWVLIDGILMLVHDDTKDAQGYILRP